jgi:hypothetical protein
LVYVLISFVSSLNYRKIKPEGKIEKEREQKMVNMLQRRQIERLMGLRKRLSITQSKIYFCHLILMSLSVLLLPGILVFLWIVLGIFLWSGTFVPHLVGSCIYGDFLLKTLKMLSATRRVIWFLSWKCMPLFFGSSSMNVVIVSKLYREGVASRR